MKILVYEKENYRPAEIILNNNAIKCDNSKIIYHDEKIIYLENKKAPRHKNRTPDKRSKNLKYK